MYNFVGVKAYALPPVDKKEALRYAGCKQADNEVFELLSICAREMEQIVSPRVCFARFSTETLLQAFPKSKLLALRLKDCQQAVVFAATIGLETDRRILQNESQSIAKALLLQALGAERIESLCNAFCKEIENGLPRFSPGFGDFPLQAQKWIFQTLGVTKNIGVTLNESLLMTPTKSVTAIVPIKG